MVFEEHMRESYDMVRQIGKSFSTNMIAWRSEGMRCFKYVHGVEKAIAERPSGRREHDKRGVLEEGQ